MHLTFPFLFILGLSAQVLAHDSAAGITDTLVASTANPSAPTTTPFNWRGGECGDYDGYAKCWAPIGNNCDNETLRSAQLSCACDNEKSAMSCFTSYCGAVTGISLSRYSSELSSFCGGNGFVAITTTTDTNSDHATATPTTSKGAVSAKSATVTTTSKGTVATLTTSSTANKETSTSVSVAAAASIVATTTSKAAANRGAGVGSGVLVGGLGVIAGVMGWFL